jgi:hypothetical protein
VWPPSSEHSDVQLLHLNAVRSVYLRRSSVGPIYRICGFSSLVESTIWQFAQFQQCYRFDSHPGAPV